jgi:hypothetical protein
MHPFEPDHSSGFLFAFSSFLSIIKLRNSPMNLNNETLKPFIGGLWYIRIVCFERGPDLYYIFRSRIKDLAFDPEKGLEVDVDDLFPNRLVNGQWIDHPTKKMKRIYAIRKGRDGSIVEPRISFASAAFLHIKIDGTADALAFHPDQEIPDDVSMLTSFPRTGYEILAQSLRPLQRTTTQV